MNLDLGLGNIVNQSVLFGFSVKDIVILAVFLLAAYIIAWKIFELGKGEDRFARM